MVFAAMTTLCNRVGDTSSERVYVLGPNRAALPKPADFNEIFQPNHGSAYRPRRSFVRCFTHIKE